MNFFKKLFSGAKSPTSPKVAETHEASKAHEPKEEERAPFSEFATHEYFDKRYQEDPMTPSMLEGSLKIIQGYFIDNKLEQKIKEPINHPLNLDQTIDEGFGFPMYCKAMKMEENYAVMFLALAFNDFLIKHHGFKLYKDNEPEFPLRTMTLKYDNEEAMLSLYPIEYVTKVLRYEASFEDLYNKIKSNLEYLPTSDDVYNKLMGKDEK